MASAWVHSVLSLIAFGRPYFDLNQQIDSWSPELRYEHRVMGHDYYQAFDKVWTMDNPFPEEVLEHCRKTRARYGDEEAEKEQVRLAHCYFDKTWDDFSQEQKESIELVVARLLATPEVLYHTVGVDVIEGKIQYQLENGELQWVDSPDLPNEYQRLIKYVSTV